MKWISVDDWLPPPGMEVLCFRPAAMNDYSDKPLRMCSRKPDGNWEGRHEVTHWLSMDMPPGWTGEHAKRQCD